MDIVIGAKINSRPMKVIVFILMLLSSNALWGQEVKRRILALWDSSEYKAKIYTHTDLHKHYEVIFNHYGYILDYHDVNNELPKPNVVKSKYHGVVSWFSDSKMKSPRSYLKWFKQVSKKNIPFFIIGNLGAFSNSNGLLLPISTINNALEYFELRFYNNFITNPIMLDIGKIKSPTLVEFERDLVGEVSWLQIVKNTAKKKETWLEIKVKNSDKTSDVVTFNNHGGYIQTGYEIYTNPQNFHTKWRVNPFEAVKRVFGVKNIPIPDTTTLCGKRISYIHIDGDGFINISDVDRKSNSGRIILDRIINKYKFPTTSSVIVAEIDPKLLGNKTAVKDARDMFESPFVEASSHTYSHPLSWEKRPSREEVLDYLGKEREDYKGTILAYQLPNYKLNYNSEIVGSLDYINNSLVAKSKRSNVILWSGSCSPPLPALKVAHDNSVLHINGGDPAFDSTYDSYSGLSPLYRKVGPYVQVYASASNENIYTNDWSGPFGGFKKVIETFINTDKVHRIKPINVYYHHYSGEKIASLKALEEVYDWLMKQDVASIYASDFIKIVHDFTKISFHKTEKDSFKVSGIKHLKTIRFSEESRYPDYAKSINVIGHYHRSGDLFLTMGPSDTGFISLTSKPPESVFLKSCNGWVKSHNFSSRKVEGVTREQSFIYEVGK